MTTALDSVVLSTDPAISSPVPKCSIGVLRALDSTDEGRLSEQPAFFRDLLVTDLQL